jgi:UDP-N-acetylglucosamine acyltransferase
MTEISPHSIVEPGAQIAAGAHIGAFCYIGPDVVIGPDSIIENNVTLTGHTTLGQRCHVFPMAVLGATIDGEEKNGYAAVGDATNIREHVTVYAGTSRRPTTIGQDNLIMIACQVGPGATVGDHGIFANCTHIAGGATIENYVRISAFSYVDEGVTVGAYTFTAGYVHVDRDAPPFAMIQGSPYRVRGANSHNLKACGFGEEDIRCLKLAFRDLYNGSGSEVNPDELARLAKDRKANPYVRTLVKTLSRAAKAAGGRNA